MKLFVPFILMCGITLFMFRCTYDNLSTDIPLNCTKEYYFQDNVKDIMLNSCAYSGCHVDGGEAPGNFVRYEELIPYIENGNFQRRVFTLQDMPPLSVTDENTLSLRDIKILKCWIEQGYLK